MARLRSGTLNSGPLVVYFKLHRLFHTKSYIHMVPGLRLNPMRGLHNYHFIPLLTGNHIIRSYREEKMKKILLILILSGLVGVSLCYAKRNAWKNTEIPPVRLEEAIKIAKGAIPMREHIDYYCINASLAKTFSEADWELHFSSEQGKEIWVSVSSDKQARISEDGFKY